MSYCGGFVRPGKLVASAALTAVIALVALPGLAGSRTPSPTTSIEAAAFQAVDITASEAQSSMAIGPLDTAARSAEAVDSSTRFVEPGAAKRATMGRAILVQPQPAIASALKPPRFTMRGVATFYDAGFTAMRLPRGTVVRVCGAGGCLERTINDYGPMAGSNRIIDLYRPDFFAVCGCASWSGTTNVTVFVY